MKLKAVQVKEAKAQGKPYKLADGKGLFLLVNPNGTKYSRLKYRFGGKEKLLALGDIPKPPWQRRGTNATGRGRNSITAHPPKVDVCNAFRPAE